MRAPKDDSLINRTLFNHDPTRLFKTTKQTGLSTAKPPTEVVETSGDQQQGDNPQQQLETEKGKDTKDTLKNTIQSHSNPNHANKNFWKQAPFQEANLVETNCLRIFFYFKEFLTDWFTELSIRPTQSNIILTVTLYLIAISSTVQKRDGDRWFKSLLGAKLPGYTTLYQETSWETFRNYTLKCLLDKNNPYLSSSFRQDHVNNLKKHDFKQIQRNSVNTQILNGNAPINETELNYTTLGQQTARAKASKISTGGYTEVCMGVSTPVQDIERKNFEFLNSPLGRGNALGFENKQFVDLYKDKALIHLRSPWEKEIRKDFVGFFVKRQLKSATQATNDTSQTTNHLVLPWYRIDACNRPNRVVLATPGKDLKDQNFNRAVDNVNKEKSLRDRREQSVLCLREKPKRFTDARKINTTYATDLNQSSAVPSHYSKERIFGLEYIFPFQTSKARVYTQNDSIPLKLESAYFTHNLLNNNPIKSGVGKRTASILEVALLNSSQSRVKETKNELFTKNNQLFFGKNFYCFQKRLRELFYWYGLFPPYNLTGLIDKKQLQSQIDKQACTTETQKNKYKENLNLDLTLEPTGEEFGEALLSQIEEETRAANSLHKEESTNTLVKDRLHKNKGRKKLSYDNLTKLVFRKFGQGLNTSSVNGLLKSDCGFVELFSKNSISSFDSKAPGLIEVALKTPSAAKQGPALIADADVDRLPPDEETLDLQVQEGATSDADKAKKKHALNTKNLGMETPGGQRQGILTLGVKKPGNLNTLDRVAKVNTLAQLDKLNLGVKKQIENLVDQFADQSDNLTDPDQLTPLEENVKTKASLLASGIDNVSAPALTMSSIAAKQGPALLADVGGDIGSKGGELQQSLALFAFKNWPLLANVNNFVQQTYASSNRFEKNDAVLTRLMSGYKFPDCAKHETNRLFREFVLPHLLVASSVSFSPSYLVNQTLLRPLYIKLPPALPFSFFEKLAFSFYSISPASTHTKSETVPRFRSAYPVSGREHNFDSPALSDITLKETPKHSDINIEYKRISLQELTEIKDVFVKLGKDYEDYLSLPKDSPPAIRISPSLEDDKAFKLKAEQNEKKDEERVTAFERLQKIREREERFELGKKLRPFAYKNQFALKQVAAGKIPVLENSALKNSTMSKTSSERSYSFPAQDIETPAFTKQENSWIDFRLGRQNMLSDRKYSFFGRKHLLTKRLVAEEQKEIDEQINKDSYRASDINLLGVPTSSNQKPAMQVSNRLAESLDEGGGTSFKRLFSNSLLTEKGDVDQLTEEHAGRLFSHKKLQKRARKGLIRLLGAPDLSAHHIKGSLNRTRKANRALRGKVIKSAYSHLRWQKKRFRSRMLGTPCQRHLVMPEITSTDWKKLLEWQIKNYLFLEEKRLEPLIKEDPENNFKIRQLHIYLPWVTIRTPSNKPFQWPYTRLDYANYIIPAHIPNQFYALPEYKPVYYWDSGKSVSLSLPAHKFYTSNLQKSQQNRGAPALLPLTRVKKGVTPYSNGIRTRAREAPYLCEPLNNQSWLLIYRLFLAFALQHLLKYVYRVSLKRFLIEMANSDVGLRVTSPKFREWLEQARPKPFYTPKKRLRDVAAIEESIPILSEIVWYLRNFGRGRAASRGFLLVGPAGAEKTSVVQAIAGECRVPVVVQSISALTLTNEDPYEQLENAFALARQQAPCVLFLDDLDVVGQSRADVIKNDVGPPDLLFALNEYTAAGRLCLANISNLLHTHLLPKAGTRTGEHHLDWQFNPLATNPVAQANVELELEQKQGSGRAMGRALTTVQQNQESQTRRLNLLLRLLTEMDGVAPLNGVVILATSEQPALLDPALLRAGRFERRIHLSLPNKERRIQLFKAGTQKIGRMQSIPWDYLGTRTTNMSGADIASAINHSAIRAILDNTVHTVESLEHGLNCINGFPNRDLKVPVLQRSDPFHYSRLAFYQAGKAVVHNLLLDHPELGFCSLNDAVKNQNHIPGTSDITRESLQVLVSDEISPTAGSRDSKSHSRSHLKKGCASLSIAGKEVLKGHLSQQSKQDSFMRPRLNSTVQSQKSGTTLSARTRVQFETRLVGLYAGKAAELLHLSSNVVSFCADQPGVKKDKLKRYQDFDSTSVAKDFYSSLSGNTSKYSKEKSIFFESPLALNVKRLADFCPAFSPSNSRRTKQKYQTNQNFGKEQLFDSDVVKPGLVSWHLEGSKSSGWLWQSNLGFSELLTASSLIHLMIDRWYLYSQKIFTYKINKVMPSLNHQQIRNETLVPLAKRLSQELDFDHIKPNFWDLTSYTSKKALPMQSNTQDSSTDELYLNKQIYQERNRTDWWQAKVCQALEMRERPYGKWYRIYLPKLEEREQNKEWIPPDTVFHQALTLSNLTTTRFKEKSKLATRTLSGALSPFKKLDWGVPGINRPLGTRARVPRTRFGESRPFAAVEPKKRVRSENSLTQPNLLQRASWLRQRSTGSASKPLIRHQDSLKRYPFPLRGGAQFKGATRIRFDGDNLYFTQHSNNARGVTWKSSLNQISSSKSVRSLRLLKLHLNSVKQSMPSLKTLNDLYLFERDSAHQKAVMNCFYTAFSLLNDNRELLDCFADHLIRYKKLRSHEISKICSFFSPSVEVPSSKSK